MHCIPKFGDFQIVQNFLGRLNAWNGRDRDLASETGVFALLDRSRYARRIGWYDKILHFRTKTQGDICI